ncbi:hypothetical protein P4O66_020386, partial [Electrophorus voltai]
QATSLLRPGPPSTVAVTAGVAQGHGVPASPRPVIPQLAVRPQQTTIQLPPGFTIPQGMVLVRTEAGQLVLVPQQVLAQAKAQNQNKANLSPRPATPSTGATFRVTTPVSQSPVTSQPIRPISPAQVKVVQAAGVASPALQKTPVVTVSSAQQHTANTTVITAGNRLQGPPQTLLKPLSTPPTATVTMTGASGFSQEMQENVKKCKNFLATLIKLASHNSPSPDTSRNVKALVQDLLDAKIEPEEFTSRLQTELKSSPQPYLVPFLKKSLPALRLTLLNSQQSLVQLGQAPASSTPLTGSTIKAPPPRALSTAVPTVRTTITQDPTATVAIKRSGAQASPTRMPMVITQAIRPQGSVVRGAAVQLRGPVAVTMQASSNQKQKLNDPGGGTFRDDDDINDVASMAGVNLNEENARILATGSELVGTQIRSCKDDTLLPAGPLHRRILEIARKLGVNEVAGDVVSLVSHATEARLRTMLENVSALAQHRADGCREEGVREQTSDVRAQLKFFEQLEKLEKQRKDEEEREILLRAAKSRSRQEDPEQARLKQKAKEVGVMEQMQQQELAQMRQRDANLTALAAIGPRKKRKLESPGPPASAGEVGAPTSCSVTLHYIFTTWQNDSAAVWNVTKKSGVRAARRDFSSFSPLHILASHIHRYSAFGSQPPFSIPVEQSECDFSKEVSVGLGGCGWACSEEASQIFHLRSNVPGGERGEAITGMGPSPNPAQTAPCAVHLVVPIARLAEASDHSIISALYESASTECVLDFVDWIHDLAQQAKPVTQDYASEQLLWPRTGPRILRNFFCFWELLGPTGCHLGPAAGSQDHTGHPQGLDLLPGAGAHHGPLAAPLQGPAEHCLSPARSGLVMLPVTSLTTVSTELTSHTLRIPPWRMQASQSHTPTRFTSQDKHGAVIFPSWYSDAEVRSGMRNQNSALKEHTVAK